MTKRMFAGGVLGLCLIATLQPPSLQAQSTVDFANRTTFMTGYVVSPPQQLAGFGVGAVFTGLRGFGFYVDGRVSTDSPAREALLPLTPTDAEADGDFFHREQSAWTNVNVSVVWGLTPEFAAYLGGGIAWETVYLNYEDFTGEKGDLGFYWVEDFDQPELHPSVTAGAFFRMGNRLIVQFGGQTAPIGFIVGLNVRVW